MFKIKGDHIRDIIQLYIVFILLVFIVYFTSPLFSFIYQVILLILFFRTEKNYLWLALVIISLAEPGSLFIITDKAHSFSLLQNTPLGLLYFWMVFSLVAVVKTYRKPVEYPFFLNGIVIAMLLYIVVLLIAFGYYKLTFISGLFAWTFIYTLPRLIRNIKEFEKFFNLIFAFVYFVLATQILFLLFGKELNVFLGGIPNQSLNANTVEEVSVALRPTSGLNISLLGVMGSAFFLVYKKASISRNYLLVTLSASLLSILLSGTRGWMIAAVIIVLSLLVGQNSKKVFALIPRMIIPLILLILLFRFIPLLNRQVDMVFQRFDTIELLMEGDKTAGGTLNRIDERGPVVMKKFWESPVLGFGFGSEGNKFNDNHVGNQNMLLKSGIIGFSMYLFLWLSYIMKLLFRNRELMPENPYKNAILILIGCLFALIFIHSTSSQWFAYSLGFGRGLIWIIILFMGNYAYYDSIHLERTKSIES